MLLAGKSGFRNPALCAKFWSIVERHRVTVFSGVPTVYAMLLDQDSRGFDLSSLRYGICGAAPMPPATLARFEEKTGLTVLEGFGMTEGTCVSTLNPRYGPRKLGTIGVPVLFHDVKPAILNQGGGFLRFAEKGEIGTLLISGPNVTPGYLNPANTAGLFPREAG